MPDKHARLSCSGAARWLYCPGSIRLGEQFPQTSSVYADEGTIAHKTLEAMLKEDAHLLREAQTEAEAFYTTHPELDESWKTMQDNISDMKDWLDTQYAFDKEKDPAAQLYSEQQVDLTGYIPGGLGTADVTIARTGRIHIVDLKYGKGIRVDAPGNPQLRLYALGMLEMLDMIYDVRQIRMTIYQPRLEHISTDEVTADELRTWGDTVVRPSASLALTENAPFSAGSWCRFCPASRVCRARAEHNLELEDYMRRATINEQELGDVLGRAEELTAWADDLRAGALDMLQEGRSIPGWKVVEGRSVRRFSADEPHIIAAAEKAGYAKPMLYETRMITLSQMEKLMGKKTFSAAMAGLVEKPKGKPTLAPETDGRPAMIGGKPADVFAGEFDN
jgi:hypothetical protein